MLAGYTQLDYVTSGGEPRIDFSTLNLNGASFEFDFIVKYTNAAKSFALWNTTGNSAEYYGKTGYTDNGRWIIFQYHYARSRRNAYDYVDKKLEIKFTHSGSSNTLYIKNLEDETETTGTFNQATMTADNYLRLFSGLNVDTNNLVYLYGAKITLNGVLVRDLVPCLRDADQKAGFYDVLDDSFHPSEVSAQFVAGPIPSNASINITIEGSGAYAPLPEYIHIGDDVALEAQPANNYIFGGWYQDGVLLSTNRNYSFHVEEAVNDLICKFVSTADRVPGLKRKFALYKSTGDTTTRQSTDQFIKYVEVYFPRVYKSFMDKGILAVYSSVEWLTGYQLISALSIAAFDDYVENQSSKISMFSRQNNIGDFTSDWPYDFGEPAANGFNYRLVDDSTGYYVTIATSKMGDYGQGYFYDDQDNLIVGGLQAIYQRDWAFSPVCWTTFGITGFYDGTVDEDSAIIPIQISGTGPDKKLLISSDSDGVLQGHPDILQWFLGLSDPESQYDPDDPGANSGPGGADGSYDFSFDYTPLTDLPSRISAVSSGFVSLYQIPDTTTMKNISDFMWSSDYIDNILKFVQKPEDAIISLQILPVTLSGTDISREDVKAAGITFYEAGHALDPAYVIQADRVVNQYCIVDLGTVNVPEVWGSQLDYQPYTSAEIYLPYIGVNQIDIDEIAGKEVGLVYAIDLLSGDCVAFIGVGGDLKYQFNGNCASRIPFSAQSKDLLSGAIALAAGASALVSGGSSIAAASALLSAGTTLLKDNIAHGGSISSTRGFLSLQKAVIYLRRPSQNLPYDYAKFKGYPSNITSRIGDLYGFTQIEEVHLENVNATQEEKDEIMSLLKGGVII